MFKWLDVFGFFADLVGFFGLRRTIVILLVFVVGMGIVAAYIYRPDLLGLN
jgi:hypothetical protein